MIIMTHSKPIEIRSEKASVLAWQQGEILHEARLRHATDTYVTYIQKYQK